MADTLPPPGSVTQYEGLIPDRPHDMSPSYSPGIHLVVSWAHAFRPLLEQYRLLEGSSLEKRLHCLLQYLSPRARFTLNGNGTTLAARMTFKTLINYIGMNHTRFPDVKPTKQVPKISDIDHQNGTWTVIYEGASRILVEDGKTPARVVEIRGLSIFTLKPARKGKGWYGFCITGIKTDLYTDDVRFFPKFLTLQGACIVQ